MSGFNSTRSKAIHATQLGQAESFGALRADFAQNNPGYGLNYYPSTTGLQPAADDRVVFVQGLDGRTDEPAMGDILLVRAGEEWTAPEGVAVDLLSFSLPDTLPEELPAIIRPDWDPKITDTPGGCATEGDAYRRILLTWKPEVGPYILNSLNAHRVRIKDSFSHFHPVDGGFDEFYLVQEAPEGARLLTSRHVEAIQAQAVDLEQSRNLIQSRELRAGDLVYMPRGTMHRGLGGALVQVISVPGFVPRAEIGLDHHLKAINEKLGLTGDSALPIHAGASRDAVVK
ncbi:MAG TPA: hypothetical protein VJ952_02255 [Opitutales bacterium]|nr:hypothetical protein [Opitutales bacterium]